MAVPAPAEVHKVISTAVDPVFYRTVYRDLPEDLAPFWHYFQQGWLEGRDPAPWFSAEAYLAANDDVREGGIEPLFHYLTRGRREGREIQPSRHARDYERLAGWAPAPWSFETLAGLAEGPRLDPVGAAELARNRMIAAAEFDVRYYLALNPDVAAAGVDPLDHFLSSGWKEGRDPNAQFSVQDYLESYLDVARSGENPFLHYLTRGRAEGRMGRHDLGFRYEIIARAPPPEKRFDAVLLASARLEPEPAARLVEGLGAARPGLQRLHVTFSHDNFAESSGGVQFCLQRESAIFQERGFDHLHLFPALAWHMVREPLEPGLLGVVLNGRLLGVFAARTIGAVLSEVAAPGAEHRSFAIHSLLGHVADETVELLAALSLTAGYFWLHDFASLCAGFHLVRNDVQDCAAPPPDSAACGICAYGPFRARHLQAHARLFERLALTVVAPSRTTLEFWRSSWDYPVRDAVVLPHAILQPRSRSAAPPERPFRLAFVGMPVALKGWPIFRELALRHAGDPRYDFVHLGGRPDPVAPARFVEVVVSQDRPQAMREAIEAAEADAALIWPICRETFSFTAYEAAAAGAAVITGPDSGNVAAFVRETGLGRVLADEGDLAQAFASGEILELARSRRDAQLFDLVHSGMTAELEAGRRPA